MPSAGISGLLSQREMWWLFRKESRYFGFFWLVILYFVTQEILILPGSLFHRISWVGKDLPKSKIRQKKVKIPLWQNKPVVSMIGTEGDEGLEERPQNPKINKSKVFYRFIKVGKDFRGCAVPAVPTATLSP